jgi:O-methyltransferase involved in polyketide biosynthesis
VVEVAAGLSARGLRFSRRFPKVRYLEADLPAMAAHKRGALDSAKLRGEKHEVVEIDALVDEGPTSIAGICARLDPKIGTALITEGLLGYFDRAAVEGMGRRFAAALKKFPHGVYLSDLNTAGDVGGMHSVQAFRWLLSAFARGQVHLHYDSIADAEAALPAAIAATKTIAPVPPLASDTTAGPGQ